MLLCSEMASWSFFAFRQFGFELSFIHWPEMCATCPSPVPDIPMSGALAWHPVLRPHKDRERCSIWLFGAPGVSWLKGRECHLQFPLKSLDANQMPKFGLEPSGKII